MNNGDSEIPWIRSRPSFREAHSRGSQTSTDDWEFSDRGLSQGSDSLSNQEVRPVTAANNVRRASFLLGGLHAIFNSNVDDDSPPSSSIKPEVRSPPDKGNPWYIYYRDDILPDLGRVLQCRRVWDEKCRSLADRHGKTTMGRCFSCWRQGNLRYLKEHLLASEKDSGALYIQQKKNVIKLWSHVHMALNSQKEHFEQRHGGIDLATETIAQRILRKNDGLAITSDLIGEEADQLISSNFGVDVWLSGYYKIKYFRLWRGLQHLPLQYSYRNRCRAVLTHWRAKSKMEEEGLAIDYSRYEEAKTYHRQKMIAAALQRWQTRIIILSNFASLCSRLWQSVKNERTEKKRAAFHQWTAAVEMKRVYCRAPFQCWRELAFNEKQKVRVHNRLLFVYLQWQKRRSLWKYFRLWKHQFRYGGFAALYSRRELVSELQQQKQKCQQLSYTEKTMKAKLERCDQLEMKCKRLEEQLLHSEKARSLAEQELFKLKKGVIKKSTSSHASTFQESLETLCPILMHTKNVL